MNEPIVFKPLTKERIWGGQQLKQHGFAISDDQKIGEVWTLSSHEHGVTLVQSGQFSGFSLKELWSNHPEIFGMDTSSEFPLLMKWIDASSHLSVQVHPNDTDAQRLEQQPFGKNECWYIVDCPEDASIIYGHTFQSQAEFDQALEEGVLQQHLQYVPVSKGDFLYVPAGTVHALTKGCVVLEIQQNSDTTYRLYDYDRLDPAGVPRPLHLEQARQVIQFPHFHYHEPLVQLSPFQKSLTHTPYFFVEEWTVRDSHVIPARSFFQVITVIEGTIRLNHDQFTAGATILLPAQTEQKISGNGLVLLTGPSSRTKRPLQIGVDLGGTQTRVAAIDQETVVKQLSFPTHPSAGPANAINQLKCAIQLFKQEFDITRIGIAAPGPLDAKTGCLLSPPNLPGWTRVNLTAPLHSAFDVPVSLENDANAAAFGEALFGAGKNFSSVYYVTVSTGIGGGYVYEKQLIRGANGCAGEIGNTIIEFSGSPHPVLNTGSLEGLASGTALQLRAREKQTSSIVTLLEDPEERTRFIAYLATGLANIIHTVDPDVIVIGGGVTGSADLYWEQLLAAIKERVYPSLRPNINIRLATLQGHAGVIGAAHLKGFHLTEESTLFL